MCDDPERDWRDTPPWRSTMSRELFRGFCGGLGFEVELETLLDWEGIRGLDCGSVIRKPG
jgi:hypothetical protein